MASAQHPGVIAPATAEAARPQAEPDTDLTPRAKAVTWRSCLAALLLLPVNAYWVVQMEVVRYSAHPTTISHFFNIIFIILVLTLLNRLVYRFAPRAALTRP